MSKPVFEPELLKKVTIPTWHKLFLWLFPTRAGIDISDVGTGTYVLYYKKVFGRIYIVKEEWR